MLVGNYNVFLKSPGKWLSGVGCSESPSNFGNTSTKRNRYFSDLDNNVLSWTSVPNGYRPSGSWIIAKTDGGMVSHYTSDGSGVVSGGNLAGGLNAIAALAGSGDITSALAALIVSAIAALSGSGVISDAGIVAVLNAVAALSASGSVTNADLKALGDLVAAVTGTGTVTPTVSALGELTADLTPFTELSPEALAGAVWSAVAAAHTDSGSMGEKMNQLLTIAKFLGLK